MANAGKNSTGYVLLGVADTFDDAEKIISLGASRLGTSRLIKIMKNTDNGVGY